MKRPQQSKFHLWNVFNDEPSWWRTWRKSSWKFSNPLQSRPAGPACRYGEALWGFSSPVVGDSNRLASTTFGARERRSGALGDWQGGRRLCVRGTPDNRLGAAASADSSVEEAWGGACPAILPHRERTFGRGWKKLVSSEERVHLDKEWINTSVDVSSNGSGQEKMGYEDPEKQGVIQKWWNKWPTSASNIFSSGLMLTIGQADCWLGAWCELVDYQLIMWHFLLVWIFAHFRIGELLITKSKRLVDWALLTSLRLAWKWKDATLYQNGVTLFEGDKVVLWHGIEVTDSTSQLNQSGDKLLPMWLSLGIRFQNPSVSGFVLPTLCAWLGVGTRPVCSDCQHIFLPRNPSFYQQTHLFTNKPHFSTNKTNPFFYQQIQSSGHTHLPTKPTKS